VIDQILGQVQGGSGADTLDMAQLQGFCQKYFEVIKIETGPLKAYSEALAQQCCTPDGTISRSMLQETLFNIFRTAPDDLVEVAAAYRVTMPASLVGRDQYADRIADMDETAHGICIQISTKMSQGKPAISHEELVLFVLKRNASIEPPEARRDADQTSLNTSPADQTAKWCELYDCDLGSGDTPVEEFRKAMINDIHLHIGIYGRLAVAYGVTLGDKGQALVKHANVCHQLALKTAQSKKKDALVDQEELWEMAHLYETTCMEGKQFRAPSLVAKLHKLTPQTAEGFHKVEEFTRILELFFCTDHEEAEELLRNSAYDGSS